MKLRTVDFNRRKRRYGRMFILPWEIGFVIFFLIPILQSLLFVFSKVSIGEDNFVTEFTGLDNIRYIFFNSAKYVDNLVDAFSSFVYSIPLIVALSLIVGVILNQSFPGRTLFRSIFFLPVIISTGVIMTYIQNDALTEAMRSGSSAAVSTGIDVSEILTGMNLSKNVTEFLVDFVNRVFDLFWSCGVQIVLFISGLQAIPEQLYDVSRVEGAGKWEEFWYVTFPMINGTVILVIVFTAIEIFTSTANPVITQAYTAMQQQIYDRSAAMMWVYFAASGTVLGLTVLLLRKRLFDKWNS